MTETAFKVPRYDMWPTLAIMTVGALAGAVIGIIVTFAVSAFGATLSGPLGFLIFGPLLIALYGMSFSVVLVLTPLWALGGGYLFAQSRGGSGGAAAKRLGVTLFDEPHPLRQRARAFSEQLGIPSVKFVGWYDAEDINAFAVGTDQNNAMVAFSKGAIEKLTKEQLDAVLGHELGHVASNDMARMTYAHGVREALTFFLVFRGLKQFARWLFTPVSELELLRFSRRREFTADAIGARLTSPDAMISVLELFKNAEQKPEVKTEPTEMMSAAFDNTIFSTHPPVEDRIAALKVLQREMNQLSAVH